LEINKTVIVASSWSSIFTLPKEICVEYFGNEKRFRPKTAGICIYWIILIDSS
jgi:hypothetical protein